MINERRAFGERLRRQREKQRVTLDEIAATTKVGASLFAGLEKGDCGRWPGGMYNRAFIRSYAAAIGLDPDDTAAEFAEYYNVPAETTLAAGETPSAKSPATPFALRLKLDVDPEELRRRALRRAIVAAGDVLAIGLLATLIAFTAKLPFWPVLAVLSIAYQAAGRLLAGISPAERLLARRRRAERAVEAQLEAEDTAVGGTASTVA